ncbi:hypothetical protein PENANT_c008G01686 [Penicillium antarcticum]|uniref:Uncharacterized protein n=1 Tax=Penicillium antarcticum TaxID=416450 RepID=A0A1V6QAL0_9EURO|nr:hypothetical protein PENANT_c008G01686 [Penicillium antarcticum]
MFLFLPYTPPQPQPGLALGAVVAASGVAGSGWAWQYRALGSYLGLEWTISFHCDIMFPVRLWSYLEE